jgi:hypothetical protein
MRYLSMLVVSALVLAGASASPAAQKKQKPDHGWSGFEVGSFVVSESTRKLGDMSTTFREKFVIKKSEMDSDDVPLGLMKELDGKFVEYGTSPRSAREKPNELGGEESKPRKVTLEIGGKKLECTVTEITVKSEKPPFTAKFVLWRGSGVKLPYRVIPNDANLALPADVVKCEMTMEHEKRSKKYTGVVEDFAAKLTIGKKELTCVVEKWNLEDIAPEIGKAVVEARVWHCADVPGVEVKVLAKGEFMGKAAELNKVVVDFQATKRKQ